MNSAYKVRFSKESEKNLRRLDKPTITRIFRSIDEIIETTRNHPNVKKMKGYEGDVFRLRVGDFRILYEIIENQVLIFIFKVGPRGDIYK